MMDFDEIYFGSRCAMHHQDPYLPSIAFREAAAEGARLPKSLLGARETFTSVAVDVYPPTSLLLVAPFAILPWGVAQTLWTAFTALSLVLAFTLMADFCSEAPPTLYLCLAGFALANSEILLLFGNSAGVAASFCLIAVWCFLKERYVWIGVLLLAISLVLKPQDAGFVWLYFLLAGPTLRKRALQTLGVVGILAVCAALWIAPSSPNWIHELQSNVHLVWAPGSLNDPGPSALSARSPGGIINLQSSLSYLWNNPRFYNPLAYFIGFGLILVWALAVLRKRSAPHSSQFALAAIAILMFLPTYHRTYDAKLLVLTLPACAVLWNRGGAKRWFALALTSAGILVTSDIPLVLILRFASRLPPHPSTMSGAVVNMICLGFIPLVLLTMGCFYLWVYVRDELPSDLVKPERATSAPVATEAT